MAVERKGLRGNLYASLMERSFIKLWLNTPLSRVFILFLEVFVMADKNELIMKLLEKFPQKRISCSEAREMARELGIEPRELGELCDEAGLKIYGCELGCF